jgi:hypothetical protein
LCPECALAFPAGTVRCPACNRFLSFQSVARRVGLWTAILMPFAIVALVAMAAGAIETRVLRGTTGPSDAYRPAVKFIQSAPELRGAGNFSRQPDSVIERWGATRWRVAGYVAGAKVHSYYSCVLRYDGQGHWQVEDFHFERLQ